jgi:hypothetical protein
MPLQPLPSFSVPWQPTTYLLPEFNNLHVHITISLVAKMIVTRRIGVIY